MFFTLRISWEEIKLSHKYVSVHLKDSELPRFRWLRRLKVWILKAAYCQHKKAEEADTQKVLRNETPSEISSEHRAWKATLHSLTHGPDGSVQVLELQRTLRDGGRMFYHPVSLYCVLVILRKLLFHSEASKISLLFWKNFSKYKIVIFSPLFFLFFF